MNASIAIFETQNKKPSKLDSGLLVYSQLHKKWLIGEYTKLYKALMWRVEGTYLGDNVITHWSYLPDAPFGGYGKDWVDAKFIHPTTSQTVEVKIKGIKGFRRGKFVSTQGKTQLFSKLPYWVVFLCENEGPHYYDDKEGEVTHWRLLDVLSKEY